jgi:dethiobiotin synthetase
LVCVALLVAAKTRGLKTTALKPVAAGCKRSLSEAGLLLNQDALNLQYAITEALPYSTLNPIALEPAIAPHIAAFQEDSVLSAESIYQACQPALSTGCDFMLVEGAGGWRVPLNDKETMADLTVMLNIPVILVVGMRLGCINHALLSAEAIANDGLTIAGWVANQVDPAMPVVDENIATLTKRFPFPFLGHIPFLSKPSGIDASGFLDIDKLLEN